MVENMDIRNSIKQTIDELPEEHLNQVSTFLKQLEGEETTNDDIQSYFGMWKDLDKTLLKNLTTDLHKNRLTAGRKIEQ